MTSGHPVLLCSAPGYDASGRVEDLAAQLNKPVVGIAIGASSWRDFATTLIFRLGRGLQPGGLGDQRGVEDWQMGASEERASRAAVAGAAREEAAHAADTSAIPTLPHHGDSSQGWRRLVVRDTKFAIFQLPVNVLRTGRIIVFERPPGLKANLLRTFATLSNVRMSKQPVERARLYFMLAWLHAILQVRDYFGYFIHFLRSRSVFATRRSAGRRRTSSARRICACPATRSISASTSSRRDAPICRPRRWIPHYRNFSPQKLPQVPWDGLRTLLSQCIYGGRIDNQFDQVLLDCFIKRLFTAHSFDANCVLIESIDGKVRGEIVFDNFQNKIGNGIFRASRCTCRTVVAATSSSSG